MPRLLAQAENQGVVIKLHIDNQDNNIPSLPVFGEVKPVAAKDIVIS